MTLWDELNREEQWVMNTAADDGWLNCIIADYLGHSEGGGAIWMMSNDVEAVRALIPRFVDVVRDMVERNLIEIREPEDGVWENASSITGVELDQVMADPKTWIWSADGDNRMVMLLPTYHAKKVLKPVPPKASPS
jgi:hypothetical protein